MRVDSKILKVFMKNLKGNIINHSPDILIGIGIAGGILSAISAVRVTPKACKIIDKEKAKKGEDLTAIEKVKYTWKLYTLPIAGGIISCGCILYSNTTNFKRNTALLTACSLGEKRLAEYQNKVIDTFGKEGEESVQKAIDKDALESNPPSKNNIFYTGNGNELCYDKMTGRYFYSSVNAIERSVNEFNKTVMDEMYMALNDFYALLNLPNVDAGDILGWHIDKGLFNVSFSSQLTSEGVPCILLTYPIMPQYTECRYY